MIKPIATNKKAIHDYFILERIEAGIVLLGTEVKSLRDGHVNLKDSYARINKGEAYLINCHISPYSCGGHFNHEPERTRKLLLKKREIKKLLGKMTEKGMTLVPTQIYFKDSKVKVEIGVAKGKKQYDKRETLREKEEKRDIERAFKGRLQKNVKHR
ncbi:SsrA-binding protein SmpB [bacterium]|nr:SsrA-binding protein SmpB [bacterium]